MYFLLLDVLMCLHSVYFVLLYLVLYLYTHSVSVLLMY
jgi:hypothetical protein